MEFLLEKSIGFAVYRTGLKLRADMARRIRKFDLTPEQWSVLTCLAEQDGLPQKQVAEITFKDQPTTGRIIDRLVEKGLVRREANPGDRRGFNIYLTPSGLDLRNQVLPVAVGMNDNAGSQLSTEERNTLLLLLSRVFASAK
jgi:DNA-binding MarR family transcriptional regulator